jgi:hypothetical protein
MMGYAYLGKEGVKFFILASTVSLHSDDFMIK